jgi:hypothetical protein
MFESKYLHWFRLLGVAVLRGYHAMKRSVEQCRDLNKPNLLIATCMRKMMATVTQVRTGCNHHIYKQEFSPYPGPSKGVFYLKSSMIWPIIRRIFGQVVGFMALNPLKLAISFDISLYFVGSLKVHSVRPWSTHFYVSPLSFAHFLVLFGKNYSEFNYTITRTCFTFITIAIKTSSTLFDLER